MSSLQRLVSLFQWHQKRMRCFLRFFTFSQSIFSTKMNLLHHSSDTRANDIKKWKTTINSNLWRTQFSFFFSQSFARRHESTFCVNRFFLFSSLQSIKTRRLIKTRKAQIREIWNNIRLRNRFRFVASVSFWEIDRFIILICKYLSHRSKSRFSTKFSQNSHSRRIYIFFFFAHIFCFRFISSRLSHLLWNFQRQLWSNRYLNHNQWIFSQCRSIEEMNSRFETKFEEEKKIVLRACSERNVDRILFYQRKFIWRLARSKTWRSQSTFDIRFSVHICFLDQIFSLCYLFSRHAFYNFIVSINFRDRFMIAYETITTSYLIRFRFILSICLTVTSVITEIREKNSSYRIMISISSRISWVSGDDIVSDDKISKR